MSATRSYSAAHFALELDSGKGVGFCRSVEGGGVKAEILTYRAVGMNQWAFRRQLARPKFEDLKLQVGMSMSEVFYEWIEAFFNGEVIRKNGAVVAGDFTLEERARRLFHDALISEVAIPKLDATDRNACYMGVTLVPEAISFAAPKGGKIKTDVADHEQTLWTPNNFEFQFLTHLSGTTNRVTRIDGFTIKQQILDYVSGDGQVGGDGAHSGFRTNGMIEFPNLTFYVPEVDAQPFIKHFTRFGIKNEKQTMRMEAELVFRDHLKKPLCTISLEGVDLASVAPDRSDSSSQDIKQVKVEISCESMKFKYHRKPTVSDTATA